jgi:hypothetical protein
LLLLLPDELLGLPAASLLLLLLLLLLPSSADLAPALLLLLPAPARPPHSWSVHLPPATLRPLLMSKLPRGPAMLGPPAPTSKLPQAHVGCPGAPQDTPGDGWSDPGVPPGASAPQDASPDPITPFCAVTQAGR